MSKIKQLWALVRFQLAMKPILFFLLMAGGFPYILTIIGFFVSRNSKFTPPLELMMGNQTLYMAAIFAPLLLAPDLGGPGKTNGIGASGTEFLLTRAIDRPLLFRSRSLLFFFLLLAIPLIGLVGSWNYPDLQISESNHSFYEQVLNHLTGSITGAADKEGRNTAITIQKGNILLALWYIWLPLGVGSISLLLLTLFRKFKYGSLFFLPLVFAMIFFSFPRLFFHGGSSFGANDWSLVT